MGLDMYLTGSKYFVRDFKQPLDLENGFDPNEGRPVDPDGDPIESTEHGLAYWRKHGPLHTYIVQAFAEGRDDCERIELGAEDLRSIARAVAANKLPGDDQSEGFFFGSREIWAELRAEAKIHAERFEQAARWLEGSPRYENGSPKQWRSVYYQASW